MFGAHLSIAGGLVNALKEAERLRMDCVQVFTTNQRQWAVRQPSDEAREAWQAGLAELGWHRGRARTVSHNSYLINLASPDPTLWRRSIARHRSELELCEQLQIPLCVAHPGAHLGRPAPRQEHGPPDPTFTRDELRGMKRIVKALDRVHRELPGYRAVTCLETTAGAGTTLGYTFEQLAWIRERVRDPDRVAYCLDTCHVTAAGYDLSTDAAAHSMLRRFGRICGRRHLRVFHLNDSQGALGSRRDRHAHIGHGTCGIACFRAIVNSPSFARVPKILETPKGCDQRGVPWDTRNIRRLRRLISR